MKRKILLVLSIVLVAALSIGLFAACTDDSGADLSGNTDLTTENNSEKRVDGTGGTTGGMLDIGGDKKGTDVGSDAQADLASSLALVSFGNMPEIEWVVNGEGEILSAAAKNVEGTEVLNEYDPVGVTVDLASGVLVEVAHRMGFVKVEVDKTKVEVSVIGENGVVVNVLVDKILDSVNVFFEKTGIDGEVLRRVVVNVDKEEVGVEVSDEKYELMISVQEDYPEMTLTELATMEVHDLIELKRAAHNEYKKLVEEIKDESIDAAARLNSMHAEMGKLQSEMLMLRGLVLISSGETKAQIEQSLAEKQAEFDELYRTYLEEIERLGDYYAGWANDWVNVWGNLVTKG